MVVRKGYADTSAGQVHYRRVEGPGDPIVLLHRTPVSSGSFAAMLELMAGARAAVALDTPGFGQSFRPPGMPATSDYARWLLAALDALRITRFHLCAHHTGTHFAAEIALLAPTRVRSLLLSGVLHAGPTLRQSIRQDVGTADPIDPDGDYLGKAWRLMRKLFPEYDAELIHTETLGALEAIAGRDQAFGAILGQDFPEVLSRVACPVAIVQACDDPLAPMLYRVRGRHPALPIRLIGKAGLAAPERQPAAYAAAALAFAAQHDLTHEEPSMTDRRFELVLTPTGYDLHETRVATPQPGPGEVLIRVRAVSINRRDISIRDFSYPAFEADRFTPTSDGAGEIVAVGEGVTSVAVGDRVVSTFFQNWRDGPITLPAVLSALGAGGPGMLAEHVLLAETGVTRIPDGWSFAEAACIPCAAVTAWSALMTLGQLRRDDWVLVIGTGGVALFALQIAVAAGAKVAILSSSDAKLERARAMGAAVTINYATTPDWASAVKQATDGGVRHAVELGGVGTLERSVASMALGGHLALVGALAGFGGELSATAMIVSALRVSAVTVGSQADHRAALTFLADNDLKPVIDSTFDLDSVEGAYARAAAGVFGKVVIELG